MRENKIKRGNTRKISSILKPQFLRLLTLILLVLLILPPVPPRAAAEEENPAFPYTQTFLISAYYSPLPGQERYVTGSLEGDKELNGEGVNSADGTLVYPGMIAAPFKYPFGTKMSIPGIGIVAVHDRGGAIVEASEDGPSFDRLDVWMGFGDAGLKRALNWGLREVEVTIYGIDPEFKEQVYIEGYSEAERFVKGIVLAPQLFKEDLWYLSEGEDVKKLQKYMQQLGFFADEITGFYGPQTREAVFNFQVSEGILQSFEDFGAGHFGVNTRKALDKAVADFKKQKEEEEFQKGYQAMQKYDDLKEEVYAFNQPLQKGAKGDPVRRLQAELKNLGYLRVEPTGYFGEVTEHAVFKLQQAWGLAAEENSPGAGTIGPQTRAKLNELLQKRIKTKSLIALKREEQTYLVEKDQIAAAF